LTQKTKHGSYITIFVLAILVLLAVYLLAFYKEPASLVLSGSADATGLGVTITQITFRLGSGGSAPQVSRVVGGIFSPVTLPNLNTIIAVAQWQGEYPWQLGNSTYEFTLNQWFGNKTSKSLVFMTPSSEITVYGKVISTKLFYINITTPATISFIAMDRTGLPVLTERLNRSGNFSIGLPNNVTYQVNGTYLAAVSETLPPEFNVTEECSKLTSPFSLDDLNGSYEIVNWSC